VNQSGKGSGWFLSFIEKDKVDNKNKILIIGIKEFY